MNKWLFLLSFSLLLFAGCGEDDNGGGGTSADNFDRAAMLTQWADNIIIPGYADFSAKTDELVASVNAFDTDLTLDQFRQVKTAWEAAYRAWQRVSMFEIGKAESLFFRNQINIYPSDTEAIDNNLLGAEYNLELPSSIDQQGFPALDYLLFGLEESEAAIFERFTNETTGVAHRDYLIELCVRLKTLTDQVVSDWNGDFRAAFISNSGNNANASVDKLVNDYLFYYEKFLRAGKVGIPAGVFSGTELPTHVEGLYHGDLSKTLLLDALAAAQDFFNGDFPNGSSLSLADYLDELDRKKEGLLLSQLINNQFDAARIEIEELSDNFSIQIVTDNIAMLEAYDALQLNVVNMKVDMLQALNISVDYVDADGD